MTAMYYHNEKYSYSRFPRVFINVKIVQKAPLRPFFGTPYKAKWIFSDTFQIKKG